MQKSYIKDGLDIDEISAILVQKHFGPKDIEYFNQRLTLIILFKLRKFRSICLQSVMQNININATLVNKTFKKMYFLKILIYKTENAFMFMFCRTLFKHIKQFFLRF